MYVGISFIPAVLTPVAEGYDQENVVKGDQMRIFGTNEPLNIMVDHAWWRVRQGTG
jgi:hypothetical protein